MNEPDINIKLCKLLDYLDGKILEVRKDNAMPFMAKITCYNMIIDLQEFIRKELEEQVEERKKQGEIPTGKYI